MKVSHLLKLLFLTVGFTVLMLLFRIYFSGRLMYIFFVWNIFLATIPLGISNVLLHVEKRNFQIIFFVLWLLFFPNSLYIITDLIHLKERYPIPLWFDIILIMSAVMNGLIPAYLSLRQVEWFLDNKLPKFKDVILFSCLFLGSFGVYLGRYLRWNSWDILSNPFGLGTQIVDRFLNPFDHPRTWGMTIVLTIFFSILYFTIKKIQIFRLT